MSVTQPQHNAAGSQRKAVVFAAAAIGWLSSRVWLVLVTLMLLVGAAHLLAGSGLTWHYLQSGAREVFSARSLHVYADHPEIQMGPITLVISAPFALLQPAWLGRLLMMFAISGAGLACLQQATVLGGSRVRANRRLILGLGAAFVPVWMEVAVHWEHPDDAMALLCIIVGLRCVRQGKWAVGAVLLALSADFKPWALAFLPLVALGAQRRWMPSVVIWAAVVAGAWAPFVLADRNTVARISAFAISNDRASVLRVFEIDTATTPSWCRTAQLIGGAGLAILLVRRDRWPAVLLAVIAFRLLLDPGTKNYYDAGLVLGAVLFDVTIGHDRWARATIISVLLVYAPSYALLHQPEIRGMLRAIALLTVVGLACWQRPIADGPVRSVRPPPQGNAG